MDVSRIAQRVVVAGAAVVALLLPGMLITAVMASRDVPSHATPGSPHVDAEFEASIVVRKFIDADGNLDTVVDQKSAAWEFELATNGTITDDAGDNRWTVTYGSRGARFTLTEVVQEGFGLLGAFCIDPTNGYSVGELKGHTLTVQLNVVRQSGDYVCEFINTPTAVKSLDGGTGTPPSNTLPPTDSVGATRTPISGGWRVVVVVLAGVLAATLVSLTDLGRRRTASRRR